jgi:hypothetical protein
MSKAQMLQVLTTLSREELDDIAERVDELRAGKVSHAEHALVRDRVAEYRKHPADVFSLDETLGEISGDFHLT